ncbi:AAA family ATPase [Stenotrophomonas maltophilia]|uniref:ATP-dependent nuclease n=1 Tax=Stenotrophomonas maltophilia TaxID=40324 RepID=UPI002ACD0F6F|nr:AAA family ATPase [Stenotrophomonas maltophilia]MDZ5787378.1 AAA family ATPase [Stenotrophomonas maltophilia]
MAISQQVIHGLNITKLKGILALDEIRFDEKPLTAILGPNGCGKSTVLHALACCYRPPEGSDGKSWQFREFFTPTSDSTWAGSSLIMHHSFRDGLTEHKDISTEYRKKADRWSPRYSRRPERDVYFIGIKSCVPRIEEETYNSAINYQTEVHADATLIKAKMGVVFNRAYTELNVHKAHAGRKYDGLALDGNRYSALAMGAGEQRVLEILSVVFKAPKYSLILIDEVDLLLHTAALTRLMQLLHDRAKEKSLQIIFTTHREAILDLTKIASIKHLHTVKNQNKTYCFSNTKPEALHRLTGERDRPLEVFVEDEMTLTIVEHELFSLGMKRYANITSYGAATNCFTLAAGLMLSGAHSVESQLFLLDGDVYASEHQRRERVNAVLTGTETSASERRERCLEGIRKLIPANDAAAAPETQLHWMIRSLPPQDDIEGTEIIELAQGIEAVDDTHSFIELIISTLNINRAAGLSRIVDVASRSPHWQLYVSELREWLELRQASVIESDTKPLPAVIPSPSAE